MRKQLTLLKSFWDCESIRFAGRKKSFCFSTKKLCCAACPYFFTLRRNNPFWIKLRSDAFLKFLSKIRLKRETNLAQACSANQHEVITSFWLHKTALCLSQLAFNNFAPYVIKTENRPKNIQKTSPQTGIKILPYPGLAYSGCKQPRLGATHFIIGLAKSTSFVNVGRSPLN